MVSDVEKVMTPPSSSSMVKNPYVPSDVFGRELVNGSFHTSRPDR